MPDDRSPCYALLTQNISVGVWHLLCPAGLVLPLRSGSKMVIVPPARGDTSIAGARKTLLHRIVRENLATFLVEAQERYPSGELPSFATV